jgi:moderate conductance mechanosensitive channel
MEELLNNWIKQIVPWLMSHGLKILLIIVGTYILKIVLSRIISKAVRIAVVSDKTMSEEAEKKREDTLIRILIGALNISLISISTLIILKELGIEIGPILAGAGILGLALGFGGQYLIRDIISGLFIIIENQYRIGDVININGTGGLVEDISLRKTTIRDLNGTVHHIPHGEIKIVSNLSKNFARINLDIGIAYNSDMEHVIKVINQTGAELADDPQYKDQIIKPPAFLRVDDFGDSAIVIKILGETKPLKQWEITGELRKRIKVAFDREGIEIPFPQRVIHSAKNI